MTGPFQTEREARNDPAVRAVRALPAGPISWRDAQAQIVLDACAKAGVTLGGFDEQVIRWLGSFEAEKSAVLAGLIERAAAGGGSNG